MDGRVLVLACLLVVSLGATGVTASDAAALDRASALSLDGTDRADVAAGSFDRSIIEITILENGSSVWEFRYERTLADEEEREEFEAFADRFREEETDLYREFREDATALAAAGHDATGREMAAASFERNASVRSQFGTDVGVVVLRFTWEGFAATEDDRVVVGDVFDGGFYLGTDQTLVVRPGEGLRFDTVSPEASQSDPDSLADSSSVTWEGERGFNDRRPRLVLEPADTAESTPAATTTETPTPTPAPGPADGDAPADGDRDRLGTALLVLLVLTGVALVAAIGRYRRHGAISLPFAGPDTDGGSDGEPAHPSPSHADTRSDAVGVGDAVAEHSDPPEVGVGSGASAAAATGASSTTPASDAPPGIPDEELLSDEDRVIRMLEANGGRMKQHRIVDETDWSKSKVSVLLSEMDEAGTVSKIRVGRENVISLHGFEPDAARSPFDEDPN